MTKKEWYKKEARQLAAARDKYGKHKAKQCEAKQLKKLTRQIGKGMVISTDLKVHGYY